ncbi:zinc-ribbon domain-containing protein [Bacillus sp. V3B]|uniref:zinc-ribbon domain-containing protein n=1 Tax=Bacillus sp. V3B TaxID=2804915 RepID=UPI0021092352|nr:zinc-ribbon domain-containing protein [Bacillus sp. V3B]MCQ6274709.1 zinc-ribbon domain-containing protein [Bacillus sp. V3B]
MPKKYIPLSQKNPKLASEWHPSKNGAITPADVAAGTNNFAWWNCEKGHEWEARINSRNRGTGCPICFGRFQEQLTKTHPKLASEWHPNKNGNLTPADVTAGSTRKVYWKCSKCSYPWLSTITNRKHGNGCPKCAGKVVTEENSLATINPKVLEEWHRRWTCEKKHSWEAAPSTRKKGHGCPVCDGQIATVETSLGTVKKELAKEWDYDRNENFTPFDILPNSNKKFWWKCSKGHSYKAAPNHRNRGEGCPYCVGKKVGKDNCLATVNPKLAAQWHPTKNEDLTPYAITAGSSIKVWWICDKGHEWQATVYSRKGSKTNKPRGCKEYYELGRRKKK